jgi:hypothetical protein
LNCVQRCICKVGVPAPSLYFFYLQSPCQYATFCTAALFYQFFMGKHVGPFQTLDSSQDWNHTGSDIGPAARDSRHMTVFCWASFSHVWRMVHKQKQLAYISDDDDDDRKAPPIERQRQETQHVSKMEVSTVGIGLEPCFLYFGC